MTTTTLHPLAARYLDDLRHAGRRLPRAAMRGRLATLILSGGLATAVCVGVLASALMASHAQVQTGALRISQVARAGATEVLGIAVLVIVLLAPIVTSVYLTRRARP